jgi:hypothetical protein
MVPSLSGGASGYMPMKGQFGFVKISGNPAHTIAHELGHGAFRLWHTFSTNKDAIYIAAQGATDNLMDYTDGKTRLYKHQWDLLHDPERMLFPSSVDEDEQMMADEISRYIDYDKLVKWLRDNRNKTVEYRFEDFLSEEYKTVFISSGLYGVLHTVRVDKEYIGIINGETVTLSLKGTLSTRKGTVTLGPSNSWIPLQIDLSHNKIDFCQYVYFDPFPETKEVAIKLLTNTVEDFECLLKIQGYTYGDGTKILYLTQFKKAFEEANNDRNKIDVLWENIPDIIAKELSNDLKWNYLVSLSQGFIDQIGTNEEKAVTKLIKSFTPGYFQEKMIEKFDNSEMVGNVFKKLGSHYRIEFIQSLVNILNDIWENENLEPKKVYIEDTKLIDDFRWAISNGIHTASNLYQFGRDYFCIDESSGWKYDCFTRPSNPVYIHEKFVELFETRPCSPIITYTGDKEIVLPAFIVQVLIRERNTHYKNDFLTLNVGSLLPNIIIKASTLARWSKLFKTGAKDVIERIIVTEDLEILNGVKAFRMSKGTNSSKVVIIGRNMDDVRLYKQGLEAKGLKVEIFDGETLIPPKTQQAWNKAVEEAKGRRLTDVEVRATDMYIKNKEWIEKIVQEGYDIYDIGNLRYLAGEGMERSWYSVFYDMELRTVFP